MPLQDVFGSDELSGRSPAIRARAPAPYAVLAPEDAERLGVTAGGGVRVSHAGTHESFAVRLSPAMLSGAVGVVQGMTGGLWVTPGARLEVTADPDYVPPTDRMIARG